MHEPHQVDQRQRVRRQGLCMSVQCSRMKEASKGLVGSVPNLCEDNKCALAYSKVQVECDVCRSCSIQASIGFPQKVFPG